MKPFTFDTTVFGIYDTKLMKESGSGSNERLLRLGQRPLNRLFGPSIACSVKKPTVM